MILKSAPYHIFQMSLLIAEKLARGRRERMYFATGFGLIQCVKALMSFEDDVRDPSSES